MRKLFLVYLLIVITVACKKEEFNIINLNENRITVLGHGGMGIASTYPMNSFESIAYSLNLGADGTEIDIEMTKDSVLVAFHDYELSDKTNLSGNIYNKTWNEISNAIYKDPIYTGYKIINLVTLFSNIGDNRKKIFALDCKNFNPDTSINYRLTYCNAILKIIDTYNIQNNVFLELKREDMIMTMKMLRPELKIFVYSDFYNGLHIAKKHQLQGIVVSLDKITKEQISEAHESGFMVTVYNVHSNKKNIEAINKNADIIESDNLKHLLKILK